MSEDTQITIDEFARVDLRVGTIRSAEAHPASAPPTTIASSSASR